jgi:regulator of telomere elongation helicase 1
MEDYYAKVKTEGGAVFFAVCRGKVSEGLDFSDDNGRAVVITGLPFPSLTDAKVKQKRSYLDHQRQILGTSSLVHTHTHLGELRCRLTNALSVPIVFAQSLSGSDWYAQQAMRAVNQAVGRVIRHSRDHGAIILADQRFVEPAHPPSSLIALADVCPWNRFGMASNQSGLSLWLRPQVKVYNQFGVVR